MEKELLEYLIKNNFKSRLEKLSKKLKNKKIIIYGAGLFFQTIQKNYDLSSLNIIYICDKKFEKIEEDSFLGFRTCQPKALNEIKADYILVATQWSAKIIEELYLKHKTKAKIIPLVKKPLKEWIKEVWTT
jgi:glutamyl-tRNA reductase